MKRLLLIIAGIAALCPAAFATPTCSTATGSNYVCVTSTLTKDASGNALSNGTVSVTVVDTSGNAHGFNALGGGQVIGRQVTAAVSGGSFAINLTDAFNASGNAATCYNLAIVDNTTGLYVLGHDPAGLPSTNQGAGTPGYECLQPTLQTAVGAVTQAYWCGSSGCNFDAYHPASAWIGPSGPWSLTIAGATVGTYQTATVTNVGSQYDAKLQFTLPGFTAHGAWSGATAYYPLDIVHVTASGACSGNGASYIASAASTNQNPVSTTGYWQIQSCDGSGSGGGAGPTTVPADITNTAFGAVPNVAGADGAITAALASACGEIGSRGAPAALYTPSGLFKLSAVPVVPASCTGLELKGEPGESIWEQDFNAVNMTSVATLSIGSAITSSSGGVTSTLYSYTVTGGSLPSGMSLFLNITGATTGALNIARTVTPTQTSATTGTFSLTTTATAGTETESAASATAQNLNVTPLLTDNANSTTIEGMEIHSGGSAGLPQGILGQIALSSCSQDAYGSFLTCSYAVTGGAPPSVGTSVAMSGATPGLNIQGVVLSASSGSFTLPLATTSPVCVTACAQTGAVADVRYTGTGVKMTGNAWVVVRNSDISGFSGAALNLGSVMYAHIEQDSFIDDNGVSLDFNGSLTSAWITENTFDHSQASAPNAADAISIKPTSGTPSYVHLTDNFCIIAHSFCDETQGPYYIASKGNIAVLVTSPVKDTGNGNALHGGFSRQGFKVSVEGDLCFDASGVISGYPCFELFGEEVSYDGIVAHGNGIAAYFANGHISGCSVIGASIGFTFGNTQGQGAMENDTVSDCTISTSGTGPNDYWHANWRLTRGQRIMVCYDTTTSAWLSPCNITGTDSIQSGTQTAYVYYASNTNTNANNSTGATFPPTWGTSFDGGVFGQVNPSTVTDNNITWTLDFKVPAGAYNLISYSCPGNYGITCGGHKLHGNTFIDNGSGGPSSKIIRITSGLSPINAFPSSTAASGGTVTLTVPNTYGSPSQNGVQGGTPAAGFTMTFSGCANSGLNAGSAAITAYTAPTTGASGTITGSYSGAAFTATTETAGTCRATIVSSSWTANSSPGDDIEGNTFIGASNGIIQVDNPADANSLIMTGNTEADPVTGIPYPLGSYVPQHISAGQLAALGGIPPSNLVNDSALVGPSGYWSSTGWTLSTGTGHDGYNAFTVNSNGVTALYLQQLAATPTNAVAGQTYTVSAWVDATGSTAGDARLTVDNCSSTATTYAATAQASAGVASRLSTTWTATATGPVCFLLNTFTNVGVITVSAPQIELGALANGYKATLPSTGTALNSMTGALTIAAGSGVSVTNSASTITISTTAASSSTASFAAGAGVTVVSGSTSGSSSSGVIRFTTSGTAPSPGAVVLTATFSPTLTAAPAQCSPAGQNTQSIPTPVGIPEVSSSGFTMIGTLQPSQTYQISYACTK